MHQTFDIEKLDDGKFKAVSHNFPNINAVGTSEEQAIEKLSFNCQYFIDNSPKQALALIKERFNKNLYCLCGVPLKEKPLGCKTR